MRAEHEVVCLARQVDRYSAGEEGTIVHVFTRTKLQPQQAYLVEFDNPPSVITLTDRDIAD